MLFVLQECPTGIVNEETFKEIYAQFFPQGGELSTFGSKLTHTFPFAKANCLPRVITTEWYL